MITSELLDAVLPHLIAEIDITDPEDEQLQWALCTLEGTVYDLGVPEAVRQGYLPPAMLSFTPTQACAVLARCAEVTEGGAQ